MAGNTPFFVTGANAKLRVNGKTVAMCTDVSYSIRVKHASPHVLGVFEAFTQEPLSYEVTGSFTVIRYIKGLKDWDKTVAPDAVNNTGNGIGAWGPKEGMVSAVSSLGAAGVTRTDQSFDPSKLHVPMMFDIEIQQKAGKNGTGILALLRGCRIVGSDFKMVKRGLALQSFSFQAYYADEDSFGAHSSGVGQTTF